MDESRSSSGGSSIATAAVMEMTDSLVAGSDQLFRVVSIGSKVSRVSKDSDIWQARMRLEPHHRRRPIDDNQGLNMAAVAPPPSTSPAVSTPDFPKKDTTVYVYLRQRTFEAAESLRRFYQAKLDSHELIKRPPKHETHVDGGGGSRRKKQPMVPQTPPVTIGEDLEGINVAVAAGGSDSSTIITNTTTRSLRPRKRSPPSPHPMKEYNYRAGPGRPRKEMVYDNGDDRTQRRKRRAEFSSDSQKRRKGKEKAKAYRRRKAKAKWERKLDDIRKGIASLKEVVIQRRWEDVLNASIGEIVDSDDETPITMDNVTKAQLVELNTRAILLLKYLTTLETFDEKPSFVKVAISVCESLPGTPHPDTLEKWRRKFMKDGFKLSPKQTGRHDRPWVFEDESIALKARQFILENAAPKGKPNMRVQDFQKFVNEVLLANVSIDMLDGLRAPISRDTARRWLMKLGCRTKTITSGVYFDGHDRADVLEYREQWLERRKEAEKFMPLYLHFTLDEAKALLVSGGGDSSSAGLSDAKIKSALLPQAQWPNPETPLLEFHVDDPDFDFSTYRMQLPHGGSWSKRVDWESSSSSGDHPKKLIHVVQDESIYKSYSSQKRAWFLEGQRVIRKKGEGRGVMASGFLTEAAGMLKLSESDVEVINAKRATRGDNSLTSLVKVLGDDTSASSSFLFLRLFNYGSGENSEGYWDNKKMIEQVGEFIDVFEHIFPGCVADLSFDWSSGHAAYSSDALIVSNMNTSFGGKDGSRACSIIERTQILEDFSSSPINLRKGDTQYLYFQPSDPPPFYKPELRREEYVGKAKGMKQILWERGLWMSGMTRNGKSCKKGVITENPSLSMENVLTQCLDFKQAQADSALAQYIRSRGHRCDFTPKYHCECSAIEYCWGRSKLFMRKACSFSFTDMLANIPVSLLEDNLSLFLIRKYFRLTRDYCKVYLSSTLGAEATKELKKYKSHRAPLVSDISDEGKKKPWQDAKARKKEWLKQRLAAYNQDQANLERLHSSQQREKEGEEDDCPPGGGDDEDEECFDSVVRFIIEEEDELSEGMNSGEEECDENPSVTTLPTHLIPENTHPSYL